MSTYNFKKETKLYIVKDNIKYALDVYPDLSISQTFNETNVPVKTLHSQYDMFENAVINTANPANFNFTCALVKETHTDILLKLLLEFDTSNIEAALHTADIYVEGNSEIYKLEKAVFESGVFQFSRDALVLLNLSGTARKLSKYVGVIPGTLFSAGATKTLIYPERVEVLIDGQSEPHVASFSVEVRNNIRWVDYANLQNSLVVSGASDTMYPEVFVVEGRVISGNVQQYVTSITNTDVNSWKTTSSLTITIGSKTEWILKFNFPSIVYTNRLNIQELFTQSYDFRVNGNTLRAEEMIYNMV